MMVLLPFAMALLARPDPSLTAEQVQSQIASYGASATLSELYDDSARWAITTEGISRGNATWLEVAVSLKRVSDGGISQELNASVADGLILAPKSVLAVLRMPDSPYSLAEVCGNYEAAPEASRRAGVLRWLRRQELATRSVGLDTLKRARRECLMAIQRAKKDANKHVPE